MMIEKTINISMSLNEWLEIEDKLLKYQQFLDNKDHIYIGRVGDKWKYELYKFLETI